MSIHKVQTFTIVAGTMACNAKCPDCVSKMTTSPEQRRAVGFPDVDWTNLEIAVELAVSAGANTVLFTGKGEPTLHPGQINEYLTFLKDDRYSSMALKEMQTNALIFPDKGFREQGWLQRWYDNRLRLMSLSVVDIENSVNHQFYNPHQAGYPPLEETVGMLHDIGYTIRLSVTMMKDRVDGPDDIDRVVKYCKKTGIEQLSLRPVRKPAGETFSPKIAKWVADNELTAVQEKSIVDYVESNKDAVLERLMHGAVVYQLDGQNLCLTDCLTLQSGEEGFRQLIFYSNGMLAYDWSHPGAIILGMGPKCRGYLKRGKLSE